jgi:predicted enzyme related to lactoylglutathione lyase
MKKKPGRSATKRATKRTTKRATKRSSRKSSSTARHVHTPGLNGWITHTELASSTPEATKAWCAKVLGWTFKPSVPMPDGDYHLFAYSDKGGGGIRATKPSEAPGSTFTVHVADARASFEKALREGAEAMLAPVRVMEGVTIAVVRAPGGVPVGLSGP